MKHVGHELFLRGEGSLNARNCDEFRKTVYSLVTSGVGTIHLDLEQCTYMDSTFLGLLVGIHKKSKQAGGEGLTVYRPSSAATEHLESMGIDKLIFISLTMITFPEGLISCSSTPTQNPRDILSAHQNLMDLSPENRQRFALLAQILNQQIGQNKS